MASHRWQTRPEARRKPPSPQRFRVAFSRGLLMALLVVLLVWVGVSLVVHPLVGTRNVLGAVTLERGAPPTGPASSSPEAEGESVGSSADLAEDSAFDSRGEAAGASAESSAAAPDPHLGGATGSLLVHVVGAVKEPGVYRLPEGSRLQSAVELAGGPAPDAALSAVNLALTVEDGQQILIPTEAQAEQGHPGGLSVPMTTQPESSKGAKRVSLNTANQMELETLPGVGPALAGRIIAFREANGPFRSLSDLDAVSGIGPASLERLEPLVAF